MQEILIQGTILTLFFAVFLPFLTWGIGDFENGFIYDRKGEMRISFAIFGMIAIMTVIFHLGWVLLVYFNLISAPPTWVPPIPPLTDSEILQLRKMLP